MELGKSFDFIKTHSSERKGFFESLFRNTSHNIELRLLPSRKQLFTKYLDEVEKFIEEHPDQNIYFGVATREGGGSKEHTREVTCLFVDLDFKTFTGGEEEARRVLNEFCLKPSIVIRTGGGFHCYWLLREPVQSTEEIERYLKGLAKALNADLSVAERARILRVPYTVNHKYDPPREVTIDESIETASEPYDITDFDKFKDQANQTQEKREYTDTVSLENILGCGCKFLKFAYENRKTLSEPLWYSMVSNLARLAPKHVHTFSESYPKYNKAETDKKIMHSLNNTGPHTCETIKTLMKEHTGNDCGKNCSVSAPIVLLQRKLKLDNKSGSALQIRLISADELMEKDIPEPTWIVPGILPAGVAILAGKPKKGKSLLCLNMALSLTGGSKVFDSIEIDKIDVLYLALEDNDVSMKSRIKKILTSMQRAPINLFISTAWKRLNVGGLDDIKQALDKNPNIKLVIIDTLQKVRPPQKIKDTLYGYDYEALTGLKEIADERNVAVLVVHHLRKSPSDDPIDELSGTLGLTGAADNIIILKRINGTQKAKLSVTGRNMAEREITLMFDPQRTRWSITDDDDNSTSPERREILDLLEQSPEPISPKEIAKRLQKNETAIRHLVREMCKAGQITRVKYGKYTYTTHNTNTTHSSDDNRKDDICNGIDTTHSKEPVCV